MYKGVNCIFIKGVLFFFYRLPLLLNLSGWLFAQEEFADRWFTLCDAVFQFLFFLLQLL